MDQKKFCELYDIPPYRLSNLIHGTRRAERYRREIVELLNLSSSELHILQDSKER